MTPNKYYHYSPCRPPCQLKNEKNKINITIGNRHDITAKQKIDQEEDRRASTITATRGEDRGDGEMSRRRRVGQGGEGDGYGLAYYMLRGSAPGDDPPPPPEDGSMNAAIPDGNDGGGPMNGLTVYSLPPPPTAELNGLNVYALPPRPGHDPPPSTHPDQHDFVSEEKDYPDYSAASAAQHVANSTDAESHTPPSTTHVESPRMNVTYLRDGGNFDVFSLEDIHDKSSSEKDGFNQENPTRWLPTDDEVESAPRVPDGSESGGVGVIDCESNDGSFGYAAGDSGGVQVRYQYEVTEDVTMSDTGLAEILPEVERVITELLLPVFFGEECIDDEEEEEGRRRRMSRGHRANPRITDRRRRLTKVVGIDSRPDDFPLYGMGERKRWGMITHRPFLPYFPILPPVFLTCACPPHPLPPPPLPKYIYIRKRMRIPDTSRQRSMSRHRGRIDSVLPSQLQRRHARVGSAAVDSQRAEGGHGLYPHRTIPPRDTEAQVLGNELLAQGGNIPRITDSG
jgi:hypothetical protein